MHWWQTLSPWYGTDEDNPPDWMVWWMNWLPGHLLDRIGKQQLNETIRRHVDYGGFLRVYPGYTVKVIHKLPGSSGDPLDQGETVGIKATWTGE